MQYDLKYLHINLAKRLSVSNLIVSISAHAPIQNSLLIDAINDDHPFQINVIDDFRPQNYCLSGGFALIKKTFIIDTDGSLFLITNIHRQPF